MIHQLQVDGRDSQVPLVQVVQDPGDDSLVIRAVLVDLGVPGVVGRDADQPQQLLCQLGREHVVQKRSLLEQIVRYLKATIVNPLLAADLQRFERNLTRRLDWLTTETRILMS